ncbi:MAG: serpin family protein [Chitinispirillaceae bacterium]|nr:serpin family protein [Chitinispirillaceae bacterium]
MLRKFFIASAVSLFLLNCAPLSMPPEELNAGYLSEKTAVLANCAAEAGNSFAFELYGKLVEDGKNMAFSPYSISSALTIAFEGGRGVTSSEMRTVLHLPADSMKVRQDFRTIDSSLNHPASSLCTLTTANALWAQKDYPFVPAYFTVAQSYYGCGLTNVDFAADPEAARFLINSWVELKTNQRIKEIIPQGMLDSDTRLVISNAVYFKAEWDEKFDSALTNDMPFKLASGTTVSVKTMRQTAYFNYSETEHFQILEMPYVGKDLSMVFLLPKSAPLSAVETDVTGGRLAYWLNSMQAQKVITSIPRFKAETFYSLEDPLKALGMKVAFDQYRADFSGMSTITAIERLYIFAVLHKVFIEVCEAGTEAAAATAVIITRVSCAPGPQPEPIVFTADHSFMFLIRHIPSGSVLFLGKVENPVAGS